MNLTHAIERSYFEYIRSMGTRMHVDEGNLEYIYTGYKIHNRVFNARLKGNFDDKLLEVVQRFELWRVPISWDISPSSRPRNLGQHLERFGFVKRGEMLGMALELSQLKPLPLPQNATIEPVNEENIDIWAKVIALANQIPRTRMAMLQKIYEPTLESSVWRHYLAKVGGAGVATCSLLHSNSTPDVVGVYWVATAPKFQRQGLAVGMTSRLLLEAQQGYRWAVLQATPAGLPLYRRLGFEGDLPYTIYTRRYPR